jgi:hypothetical protein
MSHHGREMLGRPPGCDEVAQLPHHGVVTELHTAVEQGADDVGVADARRVGELAPPETAIGFAEIVQEGECA